MAEAPEATEAAAPEAAGPSKEYDAAIKDIGDKIAGLTLLQAKELTDYMKDAYGIEPAAGGGAVVMAGPADGGGEAAAAEEQTEFDVIIKSGGAKKLQVIKVVRAARSDLGSEGSQGSGRRSSQAAARRCQQGRRREVEGRAGRRRRRSRDQVTDSIRTSYLNIQRGQAWRSISEPGCFFLIA
jgi:ribosomal protein L7/L12